MVKSQSCRRIRFIVLLVILSIPAWGVLSQEKAAPINRNAVKLWYEKKGRAVPGYALPLVKRKISPAEILSPPDVGDVRVFPSTNPQTKNSIAVSPLNPEHLFVATIGPMIAREHFKLTICS